MNVFPFEENVVKKVETIPTGVASIQAPSFWDKGLRGKGIKIAVVDTGCDINHPDLYGRIIDTKNFTPDDNYAEDIVTDYSGHGTHVAGIIAANSNNDGVVGVAPESSLLILKVLTKKGGKNEWITKAIEYAVAQEVDIITISLGSKENSDDLHNAIKHAVNKNILVVCAAGNNGDGSDITSEVNYPAAYSEVITVGSIDIARQISKFSASNKELDIVAPGQNILSTAPNNQYKEMSGTSMSAPHVAGALALIKNWARNEFKRNLTESELYAQLMKKTIPLGFPKSAEGNGMLYLTADELLQKIISRDDVLSSLK